jgi:hypothetical protein
MTWTKTSDDFPDDCAVLSDAAYRLHHEGLTWSNRKLLDCRLPKTGHLGMHRWATNPDAARELVDHGFWADEGDAYVIRHHKAYQRTREQTIALQERNASNGKKGGRPKGPPREVFETQMGSQVGSQMETQGVRSRSGLDGKVFPLTPVPEDLCPQCAEQPGDCTCAA